MSQPRSNLKGNFLEKVAHKSVESKGWVRLNHEREFPPDNTSISGVEWWNSHKERREI
jgi:hypothetical protein